MDDVRGYFLGPPTAQPAAVLANKIYSIPYPIFANISISLNTLPVPHIIMC